MNNAVINSVEFLRPHNHVWTTINSRMIGNVVCLNACSVNDQIYLGQS